jgi:hypothetical protein
MTRVGEQSMPPPWMVMQQLRIVSQQPSPTIHTCVAAVRALLPIDIPLARIAVCSFPNSQYSVIMRGRH